MGQLGAAVRRAGAVRGHPHARSESGARRRAFAGRQAPRGDGSWVPRRDRAPRPGALQGWPSQRNAVGAEMTAGEIGWEVAMLVRMSKSLLRGRGLSGWRCYMDLSKYR